MLYCPALPGGIVQPAGKVPCQAPALHCTAHCAVQCTVLRWPDQAVCRLQRRHLQVLEGRPAGGAMPQGEQAAGKDASGQDEDCVPGTRPTLAPSPPPGSA